MSEKIRVADYLAGYLTERGISHIFLVSGGGIMHLLDALACSGKPEYVCAHNEAAAALMAEGYARISGMGVTYVTTGPGATNAFTGAVDAWVDSVPMLVISGQASRKQNVYNSGLPELRSMGSQEVDILPLVQHCTKYAAMVNQPEDIKYHLDRAFYEALSGRPGPVWLDIPLDVQSALIDPQELKSFAPPAPQPVSGELERQVEDAFRLLTKAERPVIIAGYGVRLAGAEKEFLELVERARIPVVSSKQGQDLLDNFHPLYQGGGGTKGTRSGNLTMQNADLLLCLGSRLAVPFIGYEYQLFAREAVKIVVDIDPLELKKPTVKPDLPVNADVRQFLRILLERLKASPLKEKSAWLEKCRSWRAEYYETPEGLSRNEAVISTADLFYRLSEVLPPRSVIIADAGSVYFTVTQAFQARQGVRVVTPACLASMGLSLPFGIGAWYADRQSLVAAVCGDGSLQMNIQELQTLYHNRIPLKLFVANNRGYLSIRNTQDHFFPGHQAASGPESGVSCPNLEKIAEAYRLPYERLSTLAELKEKLPEIIARSGPLVCEVFTDPHQIITPSLTTKKLEDGKLVSAPLEDMWPFLSRQELEREMVIKPVEY